MSKEVRLPEPIDPTNGNLEVALLDQKVAGIFRDKDYAYVQRLLDNGYWGIGIAVANEDGYTPVNGLSIAFKSMDEASEFCRGMNKHIGLPPDHTDEIIASTMGGRSYRRAH